MVDKIELKSRWGSLQNLMQQSGVAGMLVSSNINILYCAGRIVSGYVFIPAQGDAQLFVRRPVGIEGAIYIRKFEDLAQYLPSEVLNGKVMMELDSASYSEVARFKGLFTGEVVNGSAALRTVRSIKSEYELSLVRKSAERHMAAYRTIPLIFKPGMTDIELSMVLEHEFRREGSLGIFRIAGSSMEIFAGSILAGDNADVPSPYDFAMGGGGADVSLPVGANGTVIEGNMSVMVDLGGNFTGYMTDMTRTFHVGYIGEKAHHAHQTSIAICRAVEAVAKEGVAASDLYNIAYDMAKEAYLEENFMGYSQKAAFVGHGVGMEINELPVLAPRSRDILKSGMVFALEPKFVIPGVGAVGVENTYIVEVDGVERVTLSDEQMLKLN